MTEEDSKYMSPAQVAKEFGVDPKTVTRWARAGKLNFFFTLGGHRKFYREEVLKLKRERV